MINNEKKQIKVGLIGAGRIGKVHAETLAFRIPGMKLEAISDIRLDVAEQLGSQYCVPLITSQYRDILDHPEIQAIIICSSTDTHAEIAEAAALSKKHIFCEKPVDLTLERIESVLTTVSRAGVLLQVGFNRRFDAGFRKAAELVEQGCLGDVQLIRITSRDPEPPPVEYAKASGGIFLDMMVHDFDMARFLVQSEVQEIYATGNALIHPELAQLGDIDTAVAMLKFENGAICTIDNSRKATYGYDQRVEVFGSRGCVTVANTAPTQAVVWNEMGGLMERPHYFFLEKYKDAFIEEMKSFIDSIQFGRAPAVGGLDGLKAALIAIAAKRSLDEKRAVFLREIV